MIRKVKNWFNNLSTTQKVIVVCFALMLSIFLLERAVYGFFYFNSIQDGMTIFISTDNEIVDIPRNNDFSLQFDARVQNLPLCTATCVWQLRDTSTNTVVSRGEERIQQGFGRDFNFSVSASNQRQVKPYKLTLQCQNEATRYCRGTSSSSTASTIVNITYDDIELEHKSFVNNRYDEVASSWHQDIQELHFLKGVEDERLTSITDSIQSDYERVQNQLNLLEQSIRNDNPTSARNILVNQDGSQAVSMYETLRNQEEESVSLINRFIRNQTSIHAHYLVFGNQTLFDERLQSIQRVHRDFNQTPIPTGLNTSQSFATFKNSLNNTEMRRVSSQASTYKNTYKNILCNVKGFECGVSEQNRSFEEELVDSCSYLNMFEETSQIAQREFTLSLRPNQTVQETLDDFNVTQIRQQDNFNQLQEELLLLAVNETPTQNTSLLLSLIPRLESEANTFKDTYCSKNFTFPSQTLSPVLPELPNNITTYNPVRFPTQQCCSLGTCRACAFEERTPIILVHGHAIAESSQPEYSLQAMKNLANTLEQDGYFYFGHVFPQRNIESNTKRILSKLPSNVVFTTTYYTDSFAEEGEYYRLVTKAEPIETYGIRLSEVVDMVLRETGQERVDIISHSMGGLVTRSYLQNFGEDSVRSVVLIGTPNHGVSGRTARFCNVFGSENACRDMRRGSDFLQTVNSYEPSIPVMNIIGVGCQGTDYDGIVFRDEVELDWTQNFVYEGNCEGAFTLHSKLNRPRFMPEVYDDIKEFLNITNN